MGEQNGCKLLNFSGYEEPGLSSEIDHLSKKVTQRMLQHPMAPALLSRAGAATGMEQTKKKGTSEIKAVAQWCISHVFGDCS